MVMECEEEIWAILTQNVSLQKGMPYGMDPDYLNLVKPVGVLRSFIGVPHTSPEELLAINKVKLTVDFISNNELVKRVETKPVIELNETHEKQEVSLYFTMGPSKKANVSHHLFMERKHKVVVGPVEFLVDTPLHVGCFKRNGIRLTPRQPKDLTPGLCAVNCLQKDQNDIFFGMSKGSDCFCSSNIRSFMTGSLAKDESCNSPCVGSEKYTCGGQMHIDVYASSKFQSGWPGDGWKEG